MPAFLTEILANTWLTLKFALIVYAVGLVIERLRPAQRRQPWPHIGFNVLYSVPFIFLTHLLVPPLSVMTQPWIAQFGGWLPIRLPDGFGWQLLQGLLFFFVFDFFYYWLHRGQHRWPWFWAQHKLHHADRSVNVTTGQRHHFLEEPIRVFVVFLPMGMIFRIDPPTIVWLWNLLLLWGYVIHLNLRLPFGPLTPVIAGPQLHRLHHSIEPGHTDVNFAAFFPVWDRLFGTYVRPAAGEWPDTGTHDNADLNGFGRALFSPFGDWSRMLRQPRIGARKTRQERPLDPAVDSGSDQHGEH
jgi:sterol desaturase/sphingolipid hydroxylase (fatty acid hydroxylase superfamily)